MWKGLWYPKIVRESASNACPVLILTAEDTQRSLPIEQCSLQIHVYQPTENSAYERQESNPSDSNEEFNAGTLSELPSRELEGLWESLFYDGDVKCNLLSYIYATIGFSDANVDREAIRFHQAL